MSYANIDEILADGKQAIPIKHGGGLVIVGALGSQVLAAGDTSELPPGVGGTPPALATEATAGIVKKAATVPAPATMTATADSPSTATDVTMTVTDLNDLITKYNALRTDVAALRTTLDTLLTNIKAAGQVT